MSINVLKDLVREIDDTEETQWQGKREHLGASDLASDCDAYLNLAFKWANPTKVNGRVARIFNRGRREEELFRERLNRAGFALLPLMSRKFSALNGHVGGECDGWVRHKTWREPLIVEYKTMNNLSFSKLTKHGVKKSHRHYYAQMAIYGFMLNSPKVLFMAINKNDEDIYMELVDTDKELAKKMLERGIATVTGELPAVKISDDPAYFVCKMCPYQKICHGPTQLAKSCRSCAHGKPRVKPSDNVMVSKSPVEGGDSWKCGLDKDIKKFYREGCDSWSV